MTDLERARRVFYKNRFAAETTGCVIEEVSPGRAVCSLTLEPRHENALGTAMGGAVFTLGDFAFGVASNFDRDVFVSASAEIHFLAPAKGTKRLVAEAAEIRTGRRTCLYSVNVTDDRGTLCAVMTVSGAKVMERGKEKPAGCDAVVKK